ncbi:MAG: anti-sigma factor family protein [Armatimonadota bacterium]
MRCRQARRLIHELIDGDVCGDADLDQHLAECAACRQELWALERAQDAVGAVVQRDVPDQALERIAAGVTSSVQAPGRQPIRPVWRKLVPAFAAASLVMFLAGVGVGRWAWPRELTVTEVVTVPKVIERTVEVPVERVVEKEVPVFKTRYVYVERDREGSSPEAKPPPVKLEPVVIHLNASPPPVAPKLVREVRPARLAAQPEG